MTLRMQRKAHGLKVVNDCAERGISFIEKYNSSLTKNEEQKQFLLQLFACTEKGFPLQTRQDCFMIKSVKMFM